MEKLKAFIKKYWIYITVILIIILLITTIVIAKGIKKGSSDNSKNKTDKTLEESNSGENAALKALDTVVKMTDEEVSTALNVLSNGIQISDDSNDFYAEKVTKDSKEGYNNPEPYNLPFLDYKGFQMGADNENLYIKHQVYGIIPNETPYVNGDKIEEYVLKVEEISIVGKEDRITFTSDGVRFGVIGNNNIATHAAFADFPKNAPEDDSIGPNVLTGKYAGGCGYDYIISSFPLTDLKLEKGDTISFFVATESTSQMWHHATIDLLKNPKGSKFGQKIIYTIGENTYKEAK